MVLWALLASAGSVDAQAALAATTSSVTQDRLPPSARLTLRPGPGFERLAVKVARVLALRGNTTIEIGEPAPPSVDSVDNVDSLERAEAAPVDRREGATADSDTAADVASVSAGHVILVAGQSASTAHLVLGAVMGTSFDAVIELSPDGEEDARVLALAIEALRDRAIAMRERYEAERASASMRDTAVTGAEGAVGLADDLELVALELNAPAGLARESTGVGLAPIDSEDAALSAEGGLPAVGAIRERPIRERHGQMPDDYQLDLRDDDDLFPRSAPSERTLKVKPRLYLGIYGGASSESRALRTGVTTGGGLCVKGQCLLLGLEYPLPISLEQGADDVRYRYPTFSCTFYSQPFELGRFAPAVSFGVLSRVGHFERDMGIKELSSGLDSDLGIRGTVEGAFEVLEAVDVIAQAGFDYALDRWQYGDTSRGSRTAPWLQAGIRVRPE